MRMIRRVLHTQANSLPKLTRIPSSSVAAHTRQVDNVHRFESVSDWRCSRRKLFDIYDIVFAIRNLTSSTGRLEEDYNDRRKANGFGPPVDARRVVRSETPLTFALLNSARIICEQNSRKSKSVPFTLKVISVVKYSINLAQNNNQYRT